MATPARLGLMPVLARAVRPGVSGRESFGAWVSVSTRRSIRSTLASNLAVFSLGAPPAPIRPRMFQVPMRNLRFFSGAWGWCIREDGCTWLTLSCNGGLGVRWAATPPGVWGALPSALPGPGDWAVHVGLGILGLRLAVGAAAPPVECSRGRYLHVWLPSALDTAPLSREVPAVPPPSPSVLLLLSEVPTAFAGRGGLCVVIMGVLMSGDGLLGERPVSTILIGPTAYWLEGGALFSRGT